MLWPLLWLAAISWKQKALYSLVLLPGTIGYMLFRFWLFPDPSGGSFFSVELAGRAFDQLKTFVDPNGLVDWISSFNLFWIPALYAIVRRLTPSVLRGWLWFIPIVAVMILFLGGNLGRILFLTFPVVIPLALIGMREWLAPAGGSAAPVEKLDPGESQER